MEHGEPKIKGRCIDCGLLATLSKPYQVHTYLEVDQDRRDTGNVFRNFGRGNEPQEPFCIRGMARFQNEFDAAVWRTKHTADEPRAGEYRALALTVLQRPRNCPCWIEYQHGLTPEKTLELSTLTALEERLEASRRAWERTTAEERHQRDAALSFKMEQDRQAFLNSLNESNREWAKREGEMANRLVWAGLILAAAGIIIAVLLSTKDSLLWQWL
jgi:hypothetical protein